MSTGLTSVKSAKQSRSYTSNNFSNIYLQCVINKSKQFRNTINQHLHLPKSQIQHQSLQVVPKSYSLSRIQQIYKRATTPKKSPKNPKVHPKRYDDDPEEVQIVQALTKKSGIMRQSFEKKRLQTEKFEQQMQEKIILQEKMFQLRRKIYEERKLKEKTHIRNSKYINERDNSLKNTQLLKDQSRQNLILICLLASECNNLDHEVDEVQKANRELQAMKSQQQHVIAQLQKRIQKYRNLLEEQKKQFIQIKHMETIQCKVMTSVSMINSQLKEQKTVLRNNTKKKY